VLGEAVVRKMTIGLERPNDGHHDNDNDNDRRLGPRIVTTIHACLSGGAEQAETTWALDGFVSVEVRPIPPQFPVPVPVPVLDTHTDAR
jgi:hypothetical protein